MFTSALREWTRATSSSIHGLAGIQLCPFTAISAQTALTPLQDQAPAMIALVKTASLHWA
jgi:hypothetical protein